MIIYSRGSSNFHYGGGREKKRTDQDTLGGWSQQDSRLDSEMIRLSRVLIFNSLFPLSLCMCVYVVCL